jgi:hypothetical protein
MEDVMRFKVSESGSDRYVCMYVHLHSSECSSDRMCV